MINTFQNKTILFFGDSITDTCKSLNRNYPYGVGFVNMIKSELDISYPNYNIKIFNEGISGNKTEDLLARFDNDVKDKKPDYVFLLIGINDIWHLYDRGEEPNINDIISRIDLIIKKTKEINSKIILLTPFLFPTDEHFKGLLHTFYKLLNAIGKYISENEIEYIDTFHILKEHNDISVTKDSIHPTIYGHGIIAQSILDYILN